MLKINYAHFSPKKLYYLCTWINMYNRLINSLIHRFTMYQQQRGFLSSIPPVTKNLILINCLMWVATITLPKIMGLDLVKYLGLHYWTAPDFNPAQLITNMFMHDPSSIFHLFFNMFSLFLFGKVLEQVWGSKRFLFYYLSTGIGAALLQEFVWMLTWENAFALVNPETKQIVMNGEEAIQYALAHRLDLISSYLNSYVSIGASGAVFGILLAFGMLFPNAPMYVMFIPIPIKTKYVVIGYGLIELFFGVAGIQASVAHFAHLGGMLFGLLIILYWRKKGVIGGRIY